MNKEIVEKELSRFIKENSGAECRVFLLGNRYVIECDTKDPKILFKVKCLMLANTNGNFSIKGYFEEL